jgi:hypothetical protein
MLTIKATSIKLALLPVLVLCGCSLAQDQPAPVHSQPMRSPPASSAAMDQVRIAPGSVIPAKLTTSLDAKKAKTGDEVEAQVTQDLKDDDGQIMVAKGAKITGHVTEAQPHTKPQPESQLAIAFDHLTLNDGTSAQLPLSIQAIISPQSLNPNNSGNAAAPSGPPTDGGTPSNPGQRAAGGGPPVVPAPSGSSAGTYPEGQSAAPPKITGKTEGVIGFSHLNLAQASNAAQGSLITSEKNNVKLDTGTLLLLRVSQ